MTTGSSQLFSNFQWNVCCHEIIRLLCNSAVQPWKVKSRIAAQPIILHHVSFPQCSVRRGSQKKERKGHSRSIVDPQWPKIVQHLLFPSAICTKPDDSARSSKHCQNYKTTWCHPNPGPRWLTDFVQSEALAAPLPKPRQPANNTRATGHTAKIRAAQKIFLDFLLFLRGTFGEKIQKKNPKIWQKIHFWLHA